MRAARPVIVYNSCALGMLYVYLIQTSCCVVFVFTSYLFSARVLLYAIP